MGDKIRSNIVRFKVTVTKSLSCFFLHSVTWWSLLWWEAVTITRSKVYVFNYEVTNGRYEVTIIRNI